MRIVQVHFLATLAAALRDFYFAYEDDARGYQYLGLELRAYVCGARVGEVVVGSGGIATAISSWAVRGHNRGVATVASGRWWSRHGVAASHPRCEARL